MPSGKRIDFLDMVIGKIYELKPFNPRQIKAGLKQLDGYMKELQSKERFRNVKWKKILEVY